MSIMLLYYMVCILEDLKKYTTSATEAPLAVVMRTKASAEVGEPGTPGLSLRVNHVDLQHSLHPWRSETLNGSAIDAPLAVMMRTNAGAEEGEPGAPGHTLHVYHVDLLYCLHPWRSETNTKHQQQKRP
jgi:hypothetical protein